ncbi:membrane protein [Alkalibacillus salilacus]|uniref:Membrane protein n=1 Tax=Alkalibacillus salilacus TaxID=284582 RepID=A0ABT9VFQ6_9BACI|nr:membrane protein [Alkalibacillus salilacus]
MTCVVFEKTFWKELFQHFQDDEIPTLAASLAYFFLLSLLPFLIFLLTLLGFLPINEQQVFDLVDSYLPGDTMSLVNSNINQLMQDQNGGLLSLGIIGTIWSASIGVNGLMRAFNRAYEIEEERSFFVARGLSILLTILLVLAIAVALALPIFGRLIGEYIFSFLGASEAFLATWETFRWVVSALMMIFVLTLLYILAPNVRVKIRHALPGAIVAMLGWQLVSLGFSYYVTNFAAYSATYGSLAGVIILMIWLFLSGMMILIGGEVNAILNIHKRRFLFR